VRPLSYRAVDLGGGTVLLEVEQELSLPRADLFPFFADAHNLERITPPWLRFSVLTRDIEMGEGATIDYRLRLHGIPLRWRSEITHWDPPRRFVDRQVAGPYARWEHVHALLERDGATLARDRVEYRLPGGHLGSLLGGRLAARDLARIFAFRREQLAGVAAELRR
jgi:ligand-binding SRPBCC domain-containing protein